MRKLTGVRWRGNSGFALLALCLAAAAPVQAAPSFLRGGTTSPNFLGSTGLLFVPSAYTVGDRGIAAGVTGSSRFSSYSVLVGPVDRFEIGGTFLDRHCDCGGDEFLLNAKFMALKESRLLPAISAGVVDATDSLGVGPSWYVVASKDIGRMIPTHPVDLKAHVGYGGGVYNDHPIAGLELGLGHPVPFTRIGVTGIAEYENRDVNVGLRARWRGLAATIGLFDFRHVGGGISYTTGLRLW